MKISIITVVFNNPLVERAIRNVAAQTHPDIEHIVVDGGSTDSTLAVIAGLRDHLSAVVGGPDRGVYDALNKGIAVATGDVIGILHSDDLFAANDVLEAVGRCFRSSSADLVYGDLRYVTRRGGHVRVVRHWKSGVFRPWKLRFGWMPPHPTVFMRRSEMRRTGDYDIRYKVAGDYDFLLRALLRPGIRVRYLRRVLVHMDVGGLSNGSAGRIRRKMQEDRLVIRRRGVGGAFTLIAKNLLKLGQLTFPGPSIE